MSTYAESTHTWVRASTRNNLIISLNFILVPSLWLIQSLLINMNGLQYNAPKVFCWQRGAIMKKPGSHDKTEIHCWRDRIDFSLSIMDALARSFHRTLNKYFPFWYKESNVNNVLTLCTHTQSTPFQMQCEMLALFIILTNVKNPSTASTQKMEMD